MNRAAKNLYTFGPFRFDPRQHLLTRDGQPIALSPKAVELLSVLVENGGQLIEKEELMEQVWPDTHVEEGNLNKNISILRKTLGQWDGGREYIETVPKRGYKFVAPVSLVSSDEPSSRAQPATGAFLIGRMVLHYRVLELLGGGGMGLIYRAEDLKLGRRVALKFLPEELANDSTALKRFEREARAASALNHPNICTIYAIEEHQKQRFIAMELLEGQTLRELISSITSGSLSQQRKGMVELSKLLDIAIQITNGLDAAHRKGIIHRDIKPANIFVTTQDQAKILDFGLAKLQEADLQERHASLLDEQQRREWNPIVTLTQTGMAIGTAGYMSPEQVRGEKLDARTDLFSFGMVLYEMATGQRAFSGETAPMLRDAILNQAPVPVRELNGRIPPDFEAVIHTALEKDRDARYQTASRLRADLESLRVNASSAVAHNQRTQPAGTQKRAPTTWLWGSAIAAALVIAAIIGTSYFSDLRRHSVPPPRLVPFTSYPGDKGTPAFSPDGDQLAYSWQGESSKDPGKYGIFVQPISGGRPLQVSSAAAHDDDPSWSPDGQFIAFFRHGDRWSRQAGSYYIVSARGGAERKLADAYKEPFGSGVSWSPDGKILAVADRAAEQDMHAGIFFISTETGERRDSEIKLPGPYVEMPAFSPDNKYLAFISGPSYLSSDVYVVSVHGGVPRALTSVHSYLNGVAWTPNNREVVFDSNHQGLSTLWKVSLAGGNLEPLSVAANNVFQPAISLLGNLLAVHRYAAVTNIWKVPVSMGGHPEPIRLIASTSEDSNPSYSPDGFHIAFASSRSGSFEIYECAADGSEPIQLTSMKTSSTGSPTWSPDGNWIAFDSTLGGQAGIFVVSAHGGSARRLTSEPYNDVMPSWSHDGHWIYFTSTRSGAAEIWKIAFEDGNPIQVSRTSGFRPLESRDGNSVYYFRDREVWKLDLASGHESHTTAVRDFHDWRLCGTAVCVLDRSSLPTARFIRYGSSRATTQLESIDLGRRADGNFGMDVSPDGRWLIYSRAESIESDIMLVENFR